MPKGRKGKKKGRKPPSTDSVFVRENHSAPWADVQFDPADLGRRPMSMALVQHPPKRIEDGIYWMKKTVTATLGVASGGGITELGIAPSLGNFSESAQFVALFDQYCIYSLIARAKLEVTNLPVVEATFGRILSCVDFDSIGAISTENAYLEFSSAQSSELTIGKSYERFCKPCITVVTGSSNVTTNTGLAMTRSWVNTSQTAIPHFGFRFATIGNNTAANQVVNITITAILGFRNGV